MDFFIKTDANRPCHRRIALLFRMAKLRAAIQSGEYNARHLGIIWQTIRELEEDFNQEIAKNTT